LVILTSLTGFILNFWRHDIQHKNTWLTSTELTIVTLSVSLNDVNVE